MLVTTGVLAAVCGFAGSALGLVVLHDEFQGERGQVGPVGPQGETGRSGPAGPSGPVGLGVESLNGGLIVRDGFTCPPGARGLSFDEVVTGVGFGGISDPILRYQIETAPLCRIQVR